MFIQLALKEYIGTEKLIEGMFSSNSGYPKCMGRDDFLRVCYVFPIIVHQLQK